MKRKSCDNKKQELDSKKVKNVQLTIETFRDKKSLYTINQEEEEGTTPMRLNDVSHANNDEEHKPKLMGKTP